MKDSSIIQNSKSSLIKKDELIFYFLYCLYFMKNEFLRNGKDLPESKCTHLVRNVEFARPVEIEDGVEGTRMSGEKIIILR